MIVFWGAGKYLNSVIDKEENRNVDKIVDSDIANLGKRIGKYTVESPEIIRNLSKDDVVYITTGKEYRKEITEAVHKLNRFVPVWYYTGKHFFETSMPELQKRKQIRKRYSGATEKDIEDWIDDLRMEEAAWWDTRMKEIKVHLQGRFREREFQYSYNDIDPKDGDIVLDVGCGPIPKYGTIVRDGKVRYYPVDTLAFQYNRLSEKYDYALAAWAQRARIVAQSCIVANITVWVNPKICVNNNEIG